MVVKKKRRKGRYHRGEYTSTKSGSIFHYRSGWELKIMQFLDADPKVESWSYEKIVIEYVSNIRTKKKRRYYPDFYVTYSDGHSEVIEVKPSRKLKQRIVEKKIEAAKIWCSEKKIEFRIITEKQMKELNLL